MAFTPLSASSLALMCLAAVLLASQCLATNGAAVLSLAVTTSWDAAAFYIISFLQYTRLLVPLGALLGCGAVVGVYRCMAARFRLRPLLRKMYGDTVSLWTLRAKFSQARSKLGGMPYMSTPGPIMLTLAAMSWLEVLLGLLAVVIAAMAFTPEFLLPGGPRSFRAFEDVIDWVWMQADFIVEANEEAFAAKQVYWMFLGLAMWTQLLRHWWRRREELVLTAAARRNQIPSRFTPRPGDDSPENVTKEERLGAAFWRAHNTEPSVWEHMGIPQPSLVEVLCVIASVQGLLQGVVGNVDVNMQWLPLYTATRPRLVAEAVRLSYILRRLYTNWALVIVVVGAAVAFAFLQVMWQRTVWAEHYHRVRTELASRPARRGPGLTRRDLDREAEKATKCAMGPCPETLARLKEVGLGLGSIWVALGFGVLLMLWAQFPGYLPAYALPAFRGAEMLGDGSLFPPEPVPASVTGGFVADLSMAARINLMAVRVWRRDGLDGVQVALEALRAATESARGKNGRKPGPAEKRAQKDALVVLVKMQALGLSAVDWEVGGEWSMEQPWEQRAALVDGRSRLRVAKSLLERIKGQQSGYAPSTRAHSKAAQKEAEESDWYDVCSDIYDKYSANDNDGTPAKKQGSSDVPSRVAATDRADTAKRGEQRRERRNAPSAAKGGSSPASHESHVEHSTRDQDVYKKPGATSSAGEGNVQDSEHKEAAVLRLREDNVKDLVLAIVTVFALFATMVILNPALFRSICVALWHGSSGRRKKTLEASTDAERKKPGEAETGKSSRKTPGGATTTGAAAPAAKQKASTSLGSSSKQEQKQAAPSTPPLPAAAASEAPNRQKLTTSVAPAAGPTVNSPPSTKTKAATKPPSTGGPPSTTLAKVPQGAKAAAAAAPPGDSTTPPDSAAAVCNPVASMTPKTGPAAAGAGPRASSVTSGTPAATTASGAKASAKGAAVPKKLGDDQRLAAAAAKVDTVLPYTSSLARSNSSDTDLTAELVLEPIPAPIAPAAAHPSVKATKAVNVSNAAPPLPVPTQVPKPATAASAAPAPRAWFKLAGNPLSRPSVKSGAVNSGALPPAKLAAEAIRGGYAAAGQAPAPTMATPVVASGPQLPTATVEAQPEDDEMPVPIPVPVVKKPSPAGVATVATAPQQPASAPTSPPSAPPTVGLNPALAHFLARASSKPQAAKSGTGGTTAVAVVGTPTNGGCAPVAAVPSTGAASRSSGFYGDLPGVDPALCIKCQRGGRTVMFVHGVLVHMCYCAECGAGAQPGDTCPACGEPAVRICQLKE